MDAKDFKEKVKDMRFNKQGTKRKRWNEKEEQFLRKAFKRGDGITLISMKLGRTERAVQLKIQTLHLYPAVNKKSNWKKEKTEEARR